MMRCSRPRAVLALLALAQIAIGCRHLDLADWGPVPGDRTVLTVDTRLRCCAPPAGSVVEIHRAGGGLATRFIVPESGEPHTIPDLPPGDYTVRVDARPVGGKVLEADFEARPGRRVAVIYDDGSRTWHAFAKGGEIAGIALLVTAVVAIDIALVVLSCGCYRPCLTLAVCG